MAAPLNPKQFGDFTPMASDRTLGIVGGYNRMHVVAPKAKGDYYPASDRLRDFTLEDAARTNEKNSNNFN